MQEGVLPIPSYFESAEVYAPYAPQLRIPQASVYLKANKDYNNEFSEDGKISTDILNPSAVYYRF